MRSTMENSAEFMGKALDKHARQIHRYAVTYSAGGQRPAGNQDFIKTVCRMIKDMQALLTIARRKNVLRHCNTEQIEAYMSASREILGQAVADRLSRPECAG